MTEVYTNKKYKVVVKKASSYEELSDAENWEYASEAERQHRSRPTVVRRVQLHGDYIEPVSGWYEVTNIETGIAEHRTTMLPEAIQVADSMEHALATVPWRAFFASALSMTDLMDEASVPTGPAN